MNLIFDFDGTICDSLNTAIKIVKETLPGYFTDEITPEMVRNTDLRKLLKKIKLPKKFFPKLMFKDSKEMEKKIPTLKVFPNIKSAIKVLSDKHELGIITSNSAKNIKIFLKNNNMVSYFDFVYSSDSLFGKDITLKKVLKKYDLSKRGTYYIGDQTRDIEAAKKVGIKSVAVTWGYESESVLIKSKPYYKINRPEELVSIFN